LEGFHIANIYPVSAQELYKDENYVMLLSFLAGEYKPENINPDAYVIMDNSLYEEQQNGMDQQYYIDLAETNRLRVDEFIVPDVLNDIEATIASFEANLPTIEKYKDKYNFMFVAQATTLEEQKRGIDYINQYADRLDNITVGISKLSILDRMDDELINILKTCKYPIHFLGVKLSFSELEKASAFVRGSDTQQLTYISKNEDIAPEDFYHYTRYGRREDGRGTERDVLLESDVLDIEKTKAFREEAMKQLKERLHIIR
jgi:hypothetical protein